MTFSSSSSPPPPPPPNPTNYSVPGSKHVPPSTKVGRGFTYLAHFSPLPPFLHQQPSSRLSFTLTASFRYNNNMTHMQE
ncbi:unnamed protein product, partial [Sphagnum troendelagicum]